MKTLSLALALSTFVGCAHKYRAPASDLPGDWRVDRHEVNTGMPNYVLSPEVFASAAPGAVRAPASDEQLVREMEEAEKKPSLRRMYFRALYQQWKELSASAGRKANLRSCPQYHHDRLVLDEEGRAPGRSFASTRPSKENLALYPEWALVSGGKPVWKSKGAAPKALKRGLAAHVRKLGREVRQMCEEGATDAFFRLENMVSYHAGRPEFQGREGMAALLKIPVFSNVLLMRAAPTAHEKRLVEEAHAWQLEAYLVQLEKKRLEVAAKTH